MSKKKKNQEQDKLVSKDREKALWFDSKLKFFLEMLAYTSPNGNEEYIHNFLPKGGTFDDKGNYILVTDAESKTLFCCHMDTVGSSKEQVNPIYENGWIRTGNKSAKCLGGDDRCGVLCLIHLIENKVPGTYIFHIGEECGLVGARHIRKENAPDLSKFSRAIEFDRKGNTSVITEMGITKTCSDDFAEALCKELGLGYKPDDTGVSTDVKAYEDVIPECTNISVGYRNEHGNSETIDADFLINDLLTAIISVNWESLPTKRDPKAINKSYSRYSSYTSGHNWDNEYARDWEWDDHFKDDVNTKYNRNTVSSFSNHSKILRNNGITENRGDILLDSNYCECEFCADNTGPFKDINVVGTDYMLCEKCADYLLNGWNDKEFDIEEELSEELDYLATYSDMYSNSEKNSDGENE